MPVAFSRFRIPVDMYDRMINSGLLGEDDKVELINGELVNKMPIGNPHVAAVRRLNRHFQRLVGDRAVVGVQDPIRLDDSEPEPDLCLLRFRGDFYGNSKARAADTLLVVEVADTSEEFDREIKGPMYARNGVPEFWLVCLTAGVVEVRRGPNADGTWRETCTVGRDGVLNVAALPDVTVAAAEILPAPGEPAAS
jgi:hypothetical protein